MDSPEIAATIQTLLKQQVQAVLATACETGPLMHLMAYAFRQNLTEIYIASRSSTRKVENLLRDGHSSMLWDNRSGNIQDHIDGYSLLAECEARLLNASEADNAIALLIERNSSLEKLLAMEDCVVFALAVKQFNLTLGYKQTFSWRPDI